jgi:predicted TIM-barrel fold metal-dependent hydrolase
MDGPFWVDGQWRRVDRALLQPLIAMSEAADPLAHHRYVAELVAAHPDRFVGCFVANPLLDTELTLTCLRQLVEQSGFRAVKFHPTVHGYMPFRSRDRIEPILREAARLGVPVMFHQGDPPFGHPSQLTGMMEDNRDVTFILAHFATQRVVMADEAIYVARMNPNVLLESSWVDLPRVKEGVAALGPGRIMFGSDCPVQEMGTQLRTLETLGWDPPIGIGLAPESRELMYGDNLAKLLGVSAG